jgi:hypothetical protein
MLNIFKKNTSTTFTEEEEAYLRTIGEYDAINDAIALAETVDLLPDDPQVLLDRIDKEIPDDFVEGVAQLVKIAKKDPKFFNQIVALLEVLSEAEEVEDASEGSVEKVSLADIEQEKDDEIYELIMEKVKGISKPQ